MIHRALFAPLALALMTACSGRVASGNGGDGGQEHQDSGHPTPDGGGHVGDAGGSGLAPPMSHRPTHESCAGTRPPGVQDGGQPFCTPKSDNCTNDSECPATNDAGWTNGRCTPFQQEGPEVGCPSCQYDQCSADSQCGTGSVCECGAAASSGRDPNTCVTGNCQVDSDCGSGGYCSPDVAFCGGGTVGYYCHTAEDQCDNDIECQNSPTGGRCVYDELMKKWDCQNQACPG